MMDRVCHYHGLAFPDDGACAECLSNFNANKPAPASALQVQVGGGHYKDMKIQPVEFITANKIPFIEGCIIKRICRWRSKDGIKDLEKARHFLDLLIELETRDAS